MINLKSIYIRNPQLRFLVEKERCISYILDDFYYTPENLTVLLPYEVVFLLLFDGVSDVLTVFQNFAYIFGENYDTEVKLIERGNSLLKSLCERMRYEFLLEPVTKFDKATIQNVADMYNIEDFLLPDTKIVFDPHNLRLSHPLAINFNVTTTCGFKCKYCYHPLEPIADFISVPRLRDIFSEAKSLGVESVLLSGGDPMLRPDIDDVISSIYKSGLPYTISTKSILTSERIKKYRYEYGLSTIQLSVDSVDPKIVNWHLGIDDNDYLKKLFKQIEDLLKEGVRVKIRSVITRKNIEDFSHCLKHFKNLGVDGVFVTQYRRSGFRHTDALFPTEEQCVNLTKEVLEFKKAYPSFDVHVDDFKVSIRKPNFVDDKNFFANRGVCNAGRFSMTVLPNGEVPVCENLPYNKNVILGNLTYQSIIDIWNGEAVHNWLTPPSRSCFSTNVPCATCRDDFYNRCHAIYSRCLRFCYETFFDTNTCDINCPNVSFQEYRIT